jgi:hypothetical protein
LNLTHLHVFAQVLLILALDGRKMAFLAHIHLAVSLTKKYHDILTHPPQALRAFFARIEALEMCAPDHAPYRDARVTEMVGYIARFLRLRRVEIVNFHANLARLLREVKSRQFVRKLEVDGEVYDLAEA